MFSSYILMKDESLIYLLRWKNYSVFCIEKRVTEY